MLEKRIRIVLVDDHAVVRSGLGAFMTAHDDLELVGEASNGERAIVLCQQTQPDVVLMDLMMPGMDGATATRHIREKCPNTQVLALTSFKEKELVEGALQAGAIGYLLKDISADELVSAIRSVAAGKPTLSHEAQQILIEGTRTPADKPGFDLTEREREVLTLMTEGLNNNQIAERLVVSLSTAKFHVSSILSKLNAATRAEAVSIALKKHLVK
ncbi:MAG: DNA-binding response regulator [Chloroflexi bacterium]|nr:MAG: DNA-binding response regulator [Chloroflexota bacterium]MCE7859505.1 DNA-binding response regulator [Chloroflexi bacterium CFX2]